MSRQKFRELWLREGDRNTGFFHKMVSAHKMRNSLCSFKIIGQWMFDPSGLKEGVVNTFQNLLSEGEDWRPDCERLELRELGVEEAAGLEVPFSEAELFSALTNLCGDKAPGMDGFNLAFWQLHWDVVKEEVLSFFFFLVDFFEHGSFVRSLNATFLVLIPKKGVLKS